MGIHTVENVNIACISSMGIKMYPSDLHSRKAVAQRQSVFSRHLLQLSPLGVRLRCGELPHPQPCPSPGTYIWEGSEHVAPSAWCMTTRPVHPTPGLPAGELSQVASHVTLPSAQCWVLPFAFTRGHSDERFSSQLHLSVCFRKRTLRQSLV